MEIFGVGPLEFILVLVLALVILGPEDMVGTARKIGQWVYRVVRSPTWRTIMETSQDLRALPQKIVREAGLEETMKDIKQTADEVKSDISQTTREINTEMQAATTEVSHEMQIAAKDANEGMKEAGVEAQVAMQSAADGMSGSENTIAPPQAQAALPAPDAAILVAEAEPVDGLYVNQLETIATGLGGKEILLAEPEENTIFRVTPAENAIPSAPLEQPQAKQQSYAAGLETFAQALGATTGSSREIEKPSLEPQPPWAIGIPVGLSLNDEGMEARLKIQMDKMRKSIDELEAKTRAAAGEEQMPATPQTEENTPISAQAAPSGNGSESAAAPAKARRNAKRPLEAKTSPAAEMADAEAPKQAPRKRVAKVTSPAAEAVESETPKAAPRKRAAKKTPIPETTEQDSTSAQT